MRVLAAIDETEVAGHLLDALRPWLREEDSSVDVLHVLDPGDIHDTVRAHQPEHALTPQGSWSGTSLGVEEPVKRLAEDRGQAFERARTEASDRIDRLIDEHLPGIAAGNVVIFSDDIPDAIAQIAERTGADAIAVCTRSHSALRAALFGSVSEAVIRKAKVPVIVIRPDTLVATPGASVS